MRSKPPASTRVQPAGAPAADGVAHQRRRALAVAADDRRPRGRPRRRSPAPGGGRSRRGRPGSRARGSRSPARASAARRSPRPSRSSGSGRPPRSSASSTRIPRSRAHAWYIATIRGPNSGSPSTRSARVGAARPRPAPSSAASSSSSRWAARRTSAAGGRRALRMRFEQRAGGAQPGLHAVAQLDLAEHREAPLVLPEARARPCAPAARPWRSTSSRSETSANAASSSSTPAPPSRASVRSVASAGAGATTPSGASGSSKVTFRPSPPARTNRNWSPSGTVVVGDRQRQRRQEVPLDRALRAAARRGRA